MKWFIKVLRHYADFTGRARRQEYWMFALFNFIFSLAWVFLVALLAGAAGRSVSENLSLVICLSWLAMLLLPGLTVAVRRLHDVGKSGWMLLIGLIPAFGQIWLFVQMVTDGQPGPNAYGPDPKRSPETFDDQAKLTSLGIAMIVAASASLLTIFTPSGLPPVYAFFSVLVDGALLATGIMLLKSGDRKKARTALLVLMITALVITLRGMLGWVNIADILRYGDWPFVVNMMIYPLFYLSVAGFTAALLFAKNPNLTRSVGLLVIVFAGMNLLWYAAMPQGFGSLHSALSFLTPVVFMLLVWTFLSKEEEPAVSLASETEPHYEADEKVVYQPSAPGTPTAAAPQPSSGKGLGWKIFGLFVSIGLIIGGASGELVLRGTESSGALIIVGVLFLIGDIIALATHNKSGKRKEEYEQQLAEGAITSVELAEPATIRVVRDSSIVGAIVPYKVYLNHEFIGKISNGKTLDIITSVSHNIITVFDNADNAFSGDFTTDLEAGGYAEVHVKAGRFVKR